MEDWVVVKENIKDLAEVKANHARVQAILQKWKIENPQELFLKTVVLMLGTTSAGKSSFVNYFYKISVKHSAIYQLDTHFTIIEVVSEEEFSRLLSPTPYTYKHIPQEVLQSPLPHSHDERRNQVYVTLDCSETLTRYPQFETSPLFRKHALVSAVLINDAYLLGSEAEKFTLRNTLFIDSPGFTSDAPLSQMRANVDALHRLVRVADACVFLLAADTLNLCAPQVNLLEVAVLCAVYGHRAFEGALDVWESGCQVQQRTPQAAPLLPSITDIASAMARSLFGDKAVEEKDKYSGNVCWDKVKFVITKMDNVSSVRCCRVCPCPHHRTDAEAQFFELGVILGQTLKHFKPPVFTNCFAVALPAPWGRAGSGDDREARTHSPSAAATLPAGQQPPKASEGVAGSRADALAGRPAAGGSSPGLSTGSSREGARDGSASQECAVQGGQAEQACPHLQQLMRALAGLCRYDSHLSKFEAALQNMCEAAMAGGYPRELVARAVPVQQGCTGGGAAVLPVQAPLPHAVGLAHDTPHTPHTTHHTPH
eukprot:CAMPEP_0177633112 /NCGR_PEP_ID=MMETSP0447-20121125/2659_1 /TAXON_ID=0 /ORGANISM="Stygamoeba regulata, Strain BSH-02190019" /LENGTH=539 /DNA_ID=CAMNT_0019134741 /DNA_START=68 /DNA_END=1684 /DNA_ORIENTATION=-